MTTQKQTHQPAKPIPNFLRDLRHIPSAGTPTKAGPVAQAVLDRIKLKYSDQKKRSDFLLDAMEEVGIIAKILEDLFNHRNDEGYGYQNYFDYKQAPKKPLVQPIKVETELEQKERVMTYMVDFALNKDVEKLAKQVKAGDVKIFRTYVFCVVTDVMKVEGTTFVTFRNSRKIESAVKVLGDFPVQKGPAMLVHEKDGIRLCLQGQALKENNIQFLADASWAAYQKSAK